ncbi:hypothetical protein [Salinispora sp. H7-4]|uniref:hypothetical protein n=1 Tax=Salinispora sp. H7-4 TaxID=2748321 RepID=UPI001C551522|nr:hypothetical protein [Salinispora sp. H7-4]
MVLILESRSHLDLGDLPNLLAAELGVLTVRLERAIRSLDGVSRVHVNRWGDGSAHLHLWFLARPYGQLQLRGTFLPLWDSILPPIPESTWRENLALVAAWLADFGGRQLAEPPRIQWQAPASFGAVGATEAVETTEAVAGTEAVEVVAGTEAVETGETAVDAESSASVTRQQNATGSGGTAGRAGAAGGETDGESYRETGGTSDRETDRKTGGETDRETDGEPGSVTASAGADVPAGGTDAGVGAPESESSSSLLAEDPGSPAEGTEAPDRTASEAGSGGGVVEDLVGRTDSGARKADDAPPLPSAPNAVPS